MRRQEIFAIVMTFILVIFVVINVQADNGTESLGDDIKAQQDKLDEIESLYENMQEQIDNLEKNKEDLSKYLVSLNQSSDAAQALIDNYNGQITEKQADIDIINENLSQAESKQAEQYEAMKLRMQYMYESGNMSIIDIISSDESLGEILNQFEYVSELLEYDRSKMEEYENLLLTISVMKKQAEDEMATLTAMKTEQESVVADLNNLMAEASVNIRAHEEQISQAESEAMEYESQIEEQRNSVEELRREEARRIQESISESVRASEEASKRQAALDAGIPYEELTTAGYQPADDDLTKLAAIIYCEAGGEPYEGQLAVGTVVMNRVASSKYPNTVEGVITQPYQFSPVLSGRYAIALAMTPNQSCLNAATEVLFNGVRTGTWLYFRTINNIIQGTIIGNQVFY